MVTDSVGREGEFCVFCDFEGVSDAVMLVGGCFEVEMVCTFVVFLFVTLVSPFIVGGPRF